MKKLLDPIRVLFWLDKTSSHLEAFFLSSILIVALGFAFVQVILRNFFDTGITWGDVFTRHLVIWIGFFGATLSTKADSHIRIDALTKVIPKKYLPLVEFIIQLFCIIVSLLLAKAAYKFVIDEKMAETILFASVPSWYFIVIMPVGFIIIAFRYLTKLIDLLYKFGGKKKPSEMLASEIPTELDISVKIKLS